MDQIIDVDYKEVVDLSSKTTQELVVETNALWEQVETVSNVALMLAAQAGQRLIVIKNRLKHGEWEDWCKCNLKFSLSKAGRMMKLAEKMTDENSIFSNPSTLTDVGISKVWALLNAPEDVQKEVISTTDLTEISTRELRAEIKRLKEEKLQSEDEVIKREKEIKSLTETIDSLQEQIDMLNEAPNGKEVYEKEIKELKQELKKSEKTLKEVEILKTQLKKEKEKREQLEENVKEIKQQNATETSVDQQRIIDEAVNSALENLQAEKEADKTRIVELEKKLKQNHTEDLAIYVVKSSELQHNFNSCIDSIEHMKRKDSEQAIKMKNALTAVMTAMMNRIGGI